MSPLTFSLLALALAACCAAPAPDGTAAPGASTSIVVDPAPAPDPGVEQSRERGAYKGQAMLRLTTLQQRIQQAEAALASRPDQLSALRDAHWALIRAHRAVEASGEEDFDQARAGFEAACKAVETKLDAVRLTGATAPPPPVIAAVRPHNRAQPIAQTGLAPTTFGDTAGPANSAVSCVRQVLLDLARTMNKGRRGLTAEPPKEPPDAHPLRPRLPALCLSGLACLWLRAGCPPPP